MKITFENGLSKPVANETQLSEALTTLGAPSNTFFILKQTNGAYLQAALVDGAWWVEKREEGQDHQIRAFGTESSGLFSFSELNEIASCYLDGTGRRAIVEWRELGTVAQTSDTWFSRPQVAFDKQASLVEKYRWFEAWRDYFVVRILFIGLVAVGVGYVAAFAALIWRDWFG